MDGKCERFVKRRTSVIRIAFEYHIKKKEPFPDKFVGSGFVRNGLL